LNEKFMSDQEDISQHLSRIELKLDILISLISKNDLATNPSQFKRQPNDIKSNASEQQVSSTERDLNNLDKLFLSTKTNTDGEYNPEVDYVSKLNEWSQVNRVNIKYTKKSSIVDQIPTHQAECFINDDLVSKGSSIGKSSEAKNMAAYDALNSVGEI
jgi:hypothetical protein